MDKKVKIYLVDLTRLPLSPIVIDLTYNQTYLMPDTGINSDSDWAGGRFLDENVSCFDIGLWHWAFIITHWPKSTFGKALPMMEASVKQE